MMARETVGDVIRVIARMPLPDRDREEVCAFIMSLPKDQNGDAPDGAMLTAIRLAATQPPPIEAQ